METFSALMPDVTLDRETRNAKFVGGGMIRAHPFVVLHSCIFTGVMQRVDFYNNTLIDCVFVNLRVLGLVRFHGCILGNCQFISVKAPAGFVLFNSRVRADFAGADLRGAIFEGSVVEDCNFQGADLTRANFKNAWVAGADFRDATGMDDANFTAAHFLERYPQPLQEDPRIQRFQSGFRLRRELALRRFEFEETGRRGYFPRPLS